MQSSVVFFPGDRVLAAGLPELIVRLQDPQHLAALLAAKFPTPQVFMCVAPPRPRQAASWGRCTLQQSLEISLPALHTQAACITSTAAA